MTKQPTSPTAGDRRDYNKLLEPGRKPVDVDKVARPGDLHSGPDVSGIPRPNGSIGVEAPGPGREPWVHPMRKPRKKTRAINPVPQLRQQVEIVYPEPPAEVLEAHDKANGVLDALSAARDALDSVAADQETERRAHHAAITQAVHAGTEPPTAPATDWQVEQVRREVEVDRLTTEARAAVDRFLEVQRTTLPQWRERVVSEVAANHRKARAELRKASAAIRRWRHALEAGESMSQAEGKWAKSYHRTTSGLKPSRVLDHLAEVEAVLESSDVVVSGAYLADRGDMVPPAHTRAWMAEGPRDSQRYITLSALEREENYAITDHTKGRSARGAKLTSADRAALARGVLPS